MCGGLLTIIALAAAVSVLAVQRSEGHEGLPSNQFELTVQTSLGAIKGHLRDYGDTRKEAAREFLGVPFAEPPTGALRFKPAEAKRPWSDTIEASEHAAACMQSRSSHATRLLPTSEVILLSSHLCMAHS